MVLVGPSGCGKTTALRMLAGLEDISEGRVQIGERVVNHVPSRDRDIAMVFQSYALYPHLSVYENIAFGLRVKKVPKAEIEQRVEDAARILDLEALLDRKPRNLSGGQRQRVAMGRAIVRHPQAFLMDEPLSNLDAKLRVQTRAEIAKLQHDLGVTTIYVTHDQVEALTMGDRVAVMRKGELQQVDDAAGALRPPASTSSSRGFIGSPVDEPARGDAREVRRAVTACASARRRSRSTTRRSRCIAALKAYDGREIIVGIRPEDLEDAALATDAPAGPAAQGQGRAHRGARLGDHGALLDRRRARGDRGRARAPEGHRARDRAPGSGIASESGGAVIVGRFGPRSRVKRRRADRRRRRHALAALLRSRDVSRDLRLTLPKGDPYEQVAHFRARSRRGGRLADRAGHDCEWRPRTTSTPSAAICRGSASGPAPEQKNFQAVLNAFQKKFPGVKVKYTSAGDNTPTVLSTAVAGGNPPDLASIGQPGLVQAVRRPQGDQADRLREGR